MRVLLTTETAFFCRADKKIKTKVTEETGSGSGSGPDNGSGSGAGSGSGSELPTKPTTPRTSGPGIDEESGSGSPTLATNGPGVDEEVSGDDTSATKAGSGSGGGYAEGESGDGSFETSGLGRVDIGGYRIPHSVIIIIITTMRSS